MSIIDDGGGEKLVPTQEAAGGRRFDALCVLVLLFWTGLVVWSTLFLNRLEQLYESFDTRQLPRLSSWCIVTAHYSMALLILPLWFVWAGPRHRARTLVGVLLVAFPLLVFLGTFIPWIQLHYAFD